MDDLRFEKLKRDVARSYKNYEKGLVDRDKVVQKMHKLIYMSASDNEIVYGYDK